MGINSLSTKEVAKRLAILPQSHLTPEGLTILDLVKQGRYPYQNWLQQWSEEDEYMVNKALKATKMTSLADRAVDSLSGGQRQRGWIAMTLAQGTDTILLDEPTNHLDMESIEALISALEMFEGSVVLVTHSEVILRALPNKFVICHQGDQHLFVGDYDQFLEKEGWESDEGKKAKHKSGKRKQRAELIQERSKVLKPIQKQMQSLEQKIHALEIEVDKDCQKLIEASELGEGNLISELSREIDEKKKQIDLLFNELEKLTYLFEEKSVEFDIK